MSGKLIIPVGIPGCGKSTFAETLTDARVISTDSIREMMGDVNDQSNNDKVFQLFHEAMMFHLTLGHTVFADATNVTRRARAKVTAVAQALGAETHVVLFRNVHEAVIRNQKRERVVPPEAMARMIENYERTLLELPQERYDSITEIRSVR